MTLPSLLRSFLCVVWLLASVFPVAGQAKTPTQAMVNAPVRIMEQFFYLGYHNGFAEFGELNSNQTLCFSQFYYQYVEPEFTRTLNAQIADNPAWQAHGERINAHYAQQTVQDDVRATLAQINTLIATRELAQTPTIWTEFTVRYIGTLPTQEAQALTEVIGVFDTEAAATQIFGTLEQNAAAVAERQRCFDLK